MTDCVSLGCDEAMACELGRGKRVRAWLGVVVGGSAMGSGESELDSGGAAASRRG